jgi:hypothetical protein
MEEGSTTNLNVTITILNIIHRPVFYLKTQRFGDWILSSSSGGTYSEGPNNTYHLRRRQTPVSEMYCF